MKILFTLFWTDIVYLKNWFKFESISKIIIAAAFISVFVALFIFLYLFSQVFFLNLYSYEEYGLAAAEYILHAAIILMLWFAVGSSIISTLSMLLTSNKAYDYLLVLPVRSSILVLWFFIRSIVMNFFLLMMVVSPIIISYSGIFIGKLTPTILFPLSFIILILVFISVSIGSTVGFLLVSFIRRMHMYGAVMGIISFLSISYLLIQLIFPPALSTLYEATPSDFMNLYRNLPLVSDILPTRLILNILLSGIGTDILYLVGGLVMMVILSLHYQTGKLLYCFQNLKGQSFKAITLLSPNSGKTMMCSKYPLTLKDRYSVFRTPAESGYGIFLLSLTLFFFFILWRATSLRAVSPRYQNDILLFSFSWLLFFSMSFFLRLIFPLMAKEGTSIWYIFTLPIARQKLFRSKILTGIIFSAPLMVLSFILWVILPVATDKIWILMIFGITGVVAICMGQTLLGMICPNFSQAKDPEKVSTGSMGLLTLFVSIAIGAIYTILLRQVLSGTLDWITAMGTAIIWSILILSIIFYISRRSINHYRFET